MILRNDNCMGRLLVSLVGLLVATQGMALDDGDVAALDRKCEAVRQKALAPIRADRIQTCIEQQLRAPESCKVYYATYGNVGRGPTGAPVGGYFYDLPECQAWLEARDALRLSHSRP